MTPEPRSRLISPGRECAPQHRFSQATGPCLDRAFLLPLLKTAQNMVEKGFFEGAVGPSSNGPKRRDDIGANPKVLGSCQPGQQADSRGIQHGVYQGELSEGGVWINLFCLNWRFLNVGFCPSLREGRLHTRLQILYDCKRPPLSNRC